MLKTPFRSLEILNIRQKPFVDTLQQYAFIFTCNSPPPTRWKKTASCRLLLKLSLLLLFIIPLHAYSFTLTNPLSCVSAVVNTQERSDGPNSLDEITKLPTVTRNPRVLALLESCKTNPYLFLWLSEYMSNPQLDPAMHKALRDAYWQNEVSNNKKATPVRLHT